MVLEEEHAVEAGDLEEVAGGHGVLVLHPAGGEGKRF